MQNDSIYLYLSLLLAPISSAVTWFVGRRRRKNEDIVTIQSTVDLLLARNRELTQEVLRLQNEIMELSARIAELRARLMITNKEEEQNGTVQDFN